MKRWEPYKNYLYSGLWHVHTNYTDGLNSIEEIIYFAKSRKYHLIGFVEHVREVLDYDYESFYNRIKDKCDDHDIKCVVGCEAKVLNKNGVLDLSDNVLDLADIIYGSFHGHKYSKEDYKRGIDSMLCEGIVDVWAHPFRYAVKNKINFDDLELNFLAEQIVKNKVLFEINISEINKYTSYFLKDRVKKIIGYDLHNISSFE